MFKIVQMEDQARWDQYISGQENATPYHLFGWQHVISKTYGFKPYYLAAVHSENASSVNESGGKIIGVLPLVHLKSLLFGNRLVSMPYVDHGGILADNPNCEGELIQAAMEIGRKLDAKHIELRHLQKIDCSSLKHNDKSSESIQYLPGVSLRSHKVRMLLQLPESSDALMESFKSKLRSQINRPTKAGLKAKTGGSELLSDFYRVFSGNMRDLGSPVHSARFMEQVIVQFPNDSRIAVVYKDEEPIASGFMIAFKDTMINPWASALHKHSKDSPNMMLYWSMLSYAADKGFRNFDFGRSTPEEGTFRFKTQWGAKPKPMYWYTIWVNGKKKPDDIKIDQTSGRSRAIMVRLWRRLPISVSRLIGPAIRKHIDL